MTEAPLLTVSGLTVTFPRPAGGRAAVIRGLNLELPAGRTLGLVGESGSGKSLTALAILGLIPFPGRRESGAIRLQGRELTALSEGEYQSVRGGKIAIVFQDPSTALNPVMTLGAQLVETLLQHRQIGPSEARNEALNALREVQIPAPEKRLESYPHQLSGGMKQRALIAMALACDPECVILDEPTTALDVTVQAQLLDLIEFIQNTKKTAFLLISHDLAVVSEVAHHIDIVYAGRVVESAGTAELLRSPRHPYTRGLLDAIPDLRRRKQPLRALPGQPPNPLDLPAGCPFHPRCPRAQAVCQTQDPAWTSEAGRAWACWNPEPR